MVNLDQRTSRKSMQPASWRLGSPVSTARDEREL